jgi:hypothetical protein
MLSVSVQLSMELSEELRKSLAYKASKCVTFNCLFVPFVDIVFSRTFFLFKEYTKDVLSAEE